MDRAIDEIEHVRSQFGYRLSECAVFYRTNAQSRVMEDAFRRSDIPYSVIGTVRFYERAEVKDIMSYLRLTHNPHDTVSFKRIVNVPRRGIGKTTIDTLGKYASNHAISLWDSLDHVADMPLSRGAQKTLTEFRSLIRGFQSVKDTMTIKEIATKVLDRTGYVKELEAEDTPEAKSRIENLHELISAIDEYERRSPDHSLSGYLTQISLVNDMDDWENDADRVSMMTLHLAKGLEYKVVFLVGLEEGLFPIGETGFDPQELEEERRLMYVGMTRAKERLYLSWAAQRTVFGKTGYCLPSRFIEEAGLVTQAMPRRDFSFERPSRRITEFHAEVEEEVVIHNDQPVPSTDQSPFPIGTRVSHAQFGEGQVIEKSGSGEDLKLVILFDTGNWKKLMVKYANLTIIS